MSLLRELVELLYLLSNTDNCVLSGNKVMWLFTFKLCSCVTVGCNVSCEYSLNLLKIFPGISVAIFSF